MIIVQINEKYNVSFLVKNVNELRAVKWRK